MALVKDRVGTRPRAAHALVAGLAAFVLAGLAAPALAAADVGSGHIYSIPHSRKLEGRVQIEHECTPSEGCPWLGEVSTYAEEEECPEEIEPLHRVWSGPLKKTSGTTSGRFVFTPAQEGAATLCLYVELPAEEESELIETISEVATPAPSGGSRPVGGSPPAGSSPAPGSPAGGQSSPAGSSPASGSSPAGHAGQDTIASVYRPFRANGSTFLRTHTHSGYCFTGSSAADRRDAWRCLTGNLIEDPCFSASASARSVVCPLGPWTRRALRIRLTRPLPGKFANHPAPSLHVQPWAIELFGGHRARFSSGASSVVEGDRLNYSFGSGTSEGLWGYPDRSAEPWTIFDAPFGAQHLTRHVAIRRAWM